MWCSTAFPEKGEPFRESSPQHSVSTKGLGPCASQPEGPFFSKTALVKSNTRSEKGASSDEAPYLAACPRRLPWDRIPCRAAVFRSSHELSTFRSDPRNSPRCIFIQRPNT
jgi:hypothetical protein